VSLIGPVTLLCSSAEEVLFGSDKQLLEEAIPTYLEARGWLNGIATQAQIADIVRLEQDPPLALVTMRIEYHDAEPETFALPIAVLAPDATAAPNTIVAHLHTQSGQSATLVDGSATAAVRAVLGAMTRGTSWRSPAARVVAGTMPGVTLPDQAAITAEPRVLSSDRLATTIAVDHYLLELVHRMDEGTAPELEIARFLQAHGKTGLVPRVLAWAERRTPRGDAVTLAVLEELVANEGTAWRQARGEVLRAYERVLATPPEEAPPVVPTQPLAELAWLDPPDAHKALIGTYRDLAALLGRRVAELQLALASSDDPAFAPHAYSAMDQRSKYQTGRNLVGRVTGILRRSLVDLPVAARAPAERVIAAESDILAKLDPLRSQPIDAMQIRTHGDLHLGNVLFTGKDYVLLGVGGQRERPLSERRRKRGAFNDVASMVRSFHYAAATSLTALRPEDQTRAEPWGWIWQRWASAAFLRGYLETAKGSVFVPRNPAMISVLLECALVEKAFAELRSELRRRPDMVWIPLQGIVRMLGAHAVK
jgi:maltose alpha-D-glucosyltransferase/alpha-amylase